MQVTPELIEWLENQRKQGFSEEALFNALVKGGYSAEFSRGFLDRHPVKPREAIKAVSTPPLPDISEVSSRFFDAIPPALTAQAGLFNTDNVRRALDVDVRIVAQMASPRIAVFEGLLSHTECDELVALAKPRLDTSLTVDRDSGQSVAHHARVSSGMFFQRGEHPLVKQLEARISALLSFPVEHGEGLQILNYKPGGKYDPHQDYFEPTASGSELHLSRGGQRIATLILYLNTPQAGGGTFFPDVGVTVSAVKGHAVFFSYPIADVSSRCLHGGNPVIRGEKWIATKWIRQSTFV